MQAATAFETICGESLRKGEVKSFQDVKRKIETTWDQEWTDDPEVKRKREKAKSVGLESLEYMKLLVGVASQASSLVS